MSEDFLTRWSRRKRDAVEPEQDRPPEIALLRCTPWEQIVCRENRRRSEAEPRVEPRHAEPLHVDDIGLDARQISRDAKVLDRFERHAQGRPAKQARRRRIEPFPSPVAGRCGKLAEAEPGSRHLDLGPGARERGRQLVVIPGGEGGRIGDRDAHAPYSRAPCSSGAGTSSTATRCLPGGVPTCAR